MKKIALCGNPNVGKSTVFNALTGLKQHTGNWAGKTVESARGIVKYGNEIWEVIDLPGMYSLCGGSPEEIASSDYLTFQPPDLIIVVCDAICLERNLNLAIQLRALCPQMLLCINMMDEAEKNGICINVKSIEELLKIKVIGISARTRNGIDCLKAAISSQFESTDLAHPLISSILSERFSVPYKHIYERIRKECPNKLRANLTVFRIVAEGTSFIDRIANTFMPDARCEFDLFIKREMEKEDISNEAFIKQINENSYYLAKQVCSAAIQKIAFTPSEKRQFTFDRMFSTKIWGIPIMLCMLLFILYITISGANIPSAFLSNFFSSNEPFLMNLLVSIHCPSWLCSLIINGIYRVTSWIVSVMLPPMAIFFPLFTFVEDLGLLPRIAFQLDRCFYHCCACGKQALCMCMGLGCNAVGVTGARIIQSPRERLLAILTNAFMPCNGRFPTLLSMISLFLASGNTFIGSLLLGCAILMSVLITLFCSKILSLTVLKGVSSAYTLELPPYRRPKAGEIIIRSVFDRTLFVLGRAVYAAAPAGALIWLAANMNIGNESLLNICASYLDPIGSFLGMDGTILLAFLIGLPANELVIPAMLMIYLKEGTLVPLEGIESLHALLIANGWTIWTALSVSVFTLFHWPCSTTLLTIYKETKSIKWTSLAFALPTISGIIICFLIRVLSSLI